MLQNKPILSVENLSVDIQTANGVLHAVRNVSFELNPGETLGIVGESGCGKSLTALSLLGLLPKRAKRNATNISFDGLDLQKFSDLEMSKNIRGKRISMIFQEPMTSLNPVYTIGRQMTEGLILHQKVSKKEALKKAVNLLEEVGMSSASTRMEQYPYQFSGGQRQRIMIAMALMNDPDIIIADEPTTALDVTIQAQILKLLFEMQKKHRMAMIFITHDLGIISRTANRVAVMYGGEIVESGNALEIFSSPLHPYTQGLFNCIPDMLSISHGQYLGAIPGIVPSLVGEIEGCAFSPRCSRAKSVCKEQAPELIVIEKSHSVRCSFVNVLQVENKDNDKAEFPIFPNKKEEKESCRSSSETKIAVELRNINKTFYIRRGLFGAVTELNAVRDVSLKLIKGETLALVGESGSGKSTLARILLGLQEPDSGDVIIDAQRLTGERSKSLARRVQPIFQDPYSSLNPRRTIGEIIRRPLDIHGIDDVIKRKNSVKEMMDLVGLPNRAINNFPNQLSGGQRQRVAIARALIMRPEIIICDEPTSALDVSVQSQILNLLLDLRVELGLTYFLITHDLGVVRHMADRVAVMYDGKIMEEGDANTIFSAAKHPYTQALLASVMTMIPGAGLPKIS